MIYVARLMSMIGAIVTIPSAIALFVMLVSDDTFEAFFNEHGGQIVAATLIGLMVLFLGQKLGNDLFRVRGEYERPKDFDPADRNRTHYISAD